MKKPRCSRLLVGMLRHRVPQSAPTKYATITSGPLLRLTSGGLRGHDEAKTSESGSLPVNGSSNRNFFMPERESSLGVLRNAIRSIHGYRLTAFPHFSCRGC